MSPRSRLPLLLLPALLLACEAGAPADDTAPGDETPQPEPLPFEPAGPGVAPDPSELGPFPVGVRTVTFEDRARAQADGTPRTLVTEIWYPAVEAARGQPTVHYDLRDVLTEEQLAMIAGREIPVLETVAVRDAAVRADRGRFPVVIFSHGQGSIRWQSTYYTVKLASHGFVVVSPDHQGNTLHELVRDELSPVAEGLDSRPADVSFLLDALADLPAEDPLRAQLDLGRVGLTGHSFGALTSLRAAPLDARFDVIVPQTPTSTDIAWLGFPQPVELAIPVLIQGGRLDQTLPWDEHVEPAWASLQRPRWLVEFKTAGHFTFSDLCAFDLATIAAETGIADALGFGDISDTLSDGCLPPAPEASLAQRMITLSAIGLFNAVLRESPESLVYLDQAHHDALGADVAVVTADP